MSAESRARQLAGLFEGHQAEAVDLLAELVRCESPSDDPGRVSALASFLASLLDLPGVAVFTLPCEGRGDALLARWGPDGPGTLLLGHLDTVWPAGTLASWPFTAGGGVARGPGVFDMKAGLVVAAHVLAAVSRGEVRPRGGVSLLLVPDEEVGSQASAPTTVAEARERGRCLVLEPSGEGGAAKIARKAVGTLRVRFEGVAAHAGLEPEKGASALLELARYAVFAEALADAPGGTSVVPSRAQAGSRANVVPAEAELVVDFRAWTSAEAERLASTLSAYRPADERVRVTAEGGLSRPAMEPTTASLELYRQAASLAEEIGFDLPAVRVGGASDGNLTAAAGVPTLDGLGPSGGGAHAAAEYVDLPDLSRRSALVSALVEGVEE